MDEKWITLKVLIGVWSIQIQHIQAFLPTLWWYRKKERVINFLETKELTSHGSKDSICNTKMTFFFSANSASCQVAGGSFVIYSAALVPLVNNSTFNPERRVCLGNSLWGLHVAQVLAWEAVVDAGFWQPVVSRAGTTRTKQERQRLDNSSIIRQGPALSMRICALRSELTCVITTSSLV